MRRIATWCIAAAIASSACSREQGAPEGAMQEDAFASEGVAQVDEASNAARTPSKRAAEPVAYVVEPGTALPPSALTRAVYPEGAIAAKGKPVDDAILAEADAQLDAERKRPADADATNSRDP